MPAALLILTTVALTVVSEQGVPKGAQYYRSTYDQAQTAYDAETGQAYLPYMEDPDGESAFENFMVLYDMKKREIIDPRFRIGSAKERDNHNSAWIHVDSAGYVHITCGAHNSTVYYRRSVAPHDYGLKQGLTAERAIFETASYPRIFSLPDDPGTLVVVYRGKQDPAGGSHKYLSAATSTDGGETWEHTVIADYSGRGQAPMIYNSAKMGPDGVLHCAWSWRPFHTGNIRNGVAYARSDDAGRSWKRADGTAYELPLDPDTVHYAVPEENQVVLFNWPLDGKGDPILFHTGKQKDLSFARWNGKDWESTKIADSSWVDKADFMHAHRSADGTLEVVGQRRVDMKSNQQGIFRIESKDGGATWGISHLKEAPVLASANDPEVDYLYPILVQDGRVERNVYLFSTTERRILLYDPAKAGGGRD